MTKFRCLLALLLACVLGASGFVVRSLPRSAGTASGRGRYAAAVQASSPRPRASGLSIMAVSPKQPEDKGDGELEEKGGIEPK